MTGLLVSIAAGAAGGLTVLAGFVGVLRWAVKRAQT